MYNFFMFLLICCCGCAPITEVQAVESMKESDIKRLGVYVNLDQFEDSLSLFADNNNNINGISGHTGWKFNGCLDETLEFCLVSEDFGLFLVVPKGAIEKRSVSWNYFGHKFVVINNSGGFIVVDCCNISVGSDKYKQRFIFSKRKGVIAFMYGTYIERCNRCFIPKSYFAWAGDQYPKSIFEK